MQAVEELDWRPEYGLVEGLKDSWDKDFNRGTYRKEADFSTGERCSHPWGQNPLQDPLPARYIGRCTTTHVSLLWGASPGKAAVTACQLLHVRLAACWPAGALPGTSGDVPLPLQMTWSWRRSSSPRWHDDQHLQIGALLSSLSPRVRYIPWLGTTRGETLSWPVVIDAWLCHAHFFCPLASLII